jgi:enamine deaminase RidA (YjgF/YER057c/UK114 family)
MSRSTVRVDTSSSRTSVAADSPTVLQQQRDQPVGAHTKPLPEYTTQDVVIGWQAHGCRNLDESNGADVAMERTAVNPVTWSVEMGFNQGEIVSGHTRTLYCSGQTAMSGDGKPQHDGDMAAQLALSIDNLEAVLGEAGMSLANLVRLGVYTTDVDLLFQHYGVLASRLGAAGVAPTTTMLGVTRLAIPDLMVELEGTAVA